jgi:hypothetical protein
LIRGPEESLFIVSMVMNACGPYHVNQSGQRRMRFAMFKRPYRIRNSATGVGS